MLDEELWTDDLDADPTLKRAFFDRVDYFTSNYEAPEGEHRPTPLERGQARLLVWLNLYGEKR